MYAAAAGLGGTAANTAYNSSACRECASDVKKATVGAARSLAWDAAGRIIPKRWRNALWSFSGSGDYKLLGNSLIDGGGTVSQAPRFTDSGREVTIKYREYLGDVVAPAGPNSPFSVTGYRLNPADPATFPWLSNMAPFFDQYTFNGLVFSFQSTSSDYTSNQALGSIVMFTEYDVRDTAPSDKSRMLNSAYSNEAKPSENIAHGVECAREDTPYIVKYTSINVPSVDPDAYDWGYFYIATQGGSQTAETVFGSLYVDYDVTFRKQQVPVVYPSARLYSMTYLTVATTAAGVPYDSATLSIPSSENPTVTHSGNMPTAVVEGRNYTFPPEIDTGVYLFNVQFMTTQSLLATKGNPNTQVTDFTLENCEMVRGLLPQQVFTVGDDGNRYYECTFSVRVLAPGASFVAPARWSGRDTGVGVGQTLRLHVTQVRDGTGP